MQIKKTFGVCPEGCSSSSSTLQFKDDAECRPLTVSVNYGVTHKYQHDAGSYIQCRVTMGFDFEIEVRITDNSELYIEAYRKMLEKNARWFFYAAMSNLKASEYAKCFEAMYDIGVRHGKNTRSKEFRKLLEIEQYDD